MNIKLCQCYEIIIHCYYFTMDIRMHSAIRSWCWYPSIFLLLLESEVFEREGTIDRNLLARGGSLGGPISRKKKERKKYKAGSISLMLYLCPPWTRSHCSGYYPGPPAAVQVLSFVPNMTRSMSRSNCHTSTTLEVLVKFFGLAWMYFRDTNRVGSSLEMAQPCPQIDK